MAVDRERFNFQGCKWHRPWDGISCQTCQVIARRCFTHREWVIQQTGWGRDSQRNATGVVSHLTGQHNALAEVSNAAAVVNKDTWRICARLNKQWSKRNPLLLILALNLWTIMSQWIQWVLNHLQFTLHSMGNPSQWSWIHKLEL